MQKKSQRPIFEDSSSLTFFANDGDFLHTAKKDDLELSILINDFENDWKSITITWIITDYWKAIRCRQQPQLFLSQIEFDMKMSVNGRSKVF